MSRLDKIRESRGRDGFNLSFLDIMACGLGAVILIFLIIKHNIDTGGSVESEVLIAKLETMQQAMMQMQEEVEEVAELNAEEELLGSRLDTMLEGAQTMLSAVRERQSDQEEQREQLRRSNEELAKKHAEAIVESPAPPGSETYLLGLRVEGQRIAILLDHSASMTAEKVQDIVTYKIGPDRGRQGAPKWLRARKAALWLMERVPADSEMIVIGYSEEATVLGGAGWFRRADVSAVASVQSSIQNLVPEGGTNLQNAFKLLMAQAPLPTSVYMVTDGLPTKGGDGAPRCEKHGAVDGRCRERLFQHARRSVGRWQNNVVLLPLEGDWGAGAAYWELARASGGIAISPARSWP